MLPRRFERGAPVYSRSETPLGLYIVRTGSAYFSVESVRGDKLLLKIVREGDLFGETVALDNRPAPITVEARSFLETGYLPMRRLFALRRAFPEIDLALGRVSAANLRAALLHLEELALMPLQERARSRLRTLRAQAARVREKSFPQIDITQAELAAMLGASRQAANRALSTLEQKGLVARGFRHIVVSEDC